MSMPLKEASKQIRARILELVCDSGAAHLGSALSVVDILVSLYGGMKLVDEISLTQENRNRIIMSKGHGAVALYSTLAFYGYLSAEQLQEYARPGTRLGEHPFPNCVPGVEWATGSLGHGLSVGTGMALASRVQGNKSSVYVVCSDGECNEGSVWEAAMFAGAWKLDNLTVLVDFNKWQATGRSKEVMKLDPLHDKWRAFGWETTEVDGHTPEIITSNLLSSCHDKPRCLICHTVKGKGVSFMEDDNNWHYRSPSKEQVTAGKQELGVT